MRSAVAIGPTFVSIPHPERQGHTHREGRNQSPEVGSLSSIRSAGIHSFNSVRPGPFFAWPLTIVEALGVRKLGPAVQFEVRCPRDLGHDAVIRPLQASVGQPPTHPARSRLHLSTHSIICLPSKVNSSASCTSTVHDSELSRPVDSSDLQGSQTGRV